MLSNYLVSGNLKADFDMGRFSNSILLFKPTDCGSVGCAIGHVPYAGIPKLAAENWEKYSERAFGAARVSKLWMFLFASEWSAYDNSAEGAGNRIKWILEGNDLESYAGIPEDFFGSG